MKFSVLVAVILAFPSVYAHLQSSYFPGYGFSWYNPVCGFACYNAISSAPLACTSDHTEGGGHFHGMGATTSECRANDEAFLTTVAYCLYQNCDESFPVWKRERFWSEDFILGPPVPPKWDYITTLAQISNVPTRDYNATAMNTLDETMLVSSASYQMQANFMTKFDYLEMLQARYSIVLVTIGFGTPILVTLLARLPYATTVLDRTRPYLVYPSTIGTYSVRPLPYYLGNSPTIGQTLFVSMFFILNLILSAVNYTSSQPHPWGFSKRAEMLSYIGYRTGHFGYALLPLLILFAGRNNFLLWVTNWSYSTYILLHRWIARIFALQAIIHSITLLLTYQDTGSYSTDSKQPYWLWGIVATVLTCAMLVLSQLYFRRLSYEVFLITHIVLAVLVIVGCWYHVVLRWGFNFYDNWLYAACAVWFFDRLLRVLRMAKNGGHRAVVADLGPDHVRVDIPGLRFVSQPGHVAYAYFPTLNLLRPWENHPFSLNSSSIFRTYTPSSGASSPLPSTSQSEIGSDVEKNPAAASTARVTHASNDMGTTGMTFFIKKNRGLTRLLRSNKQLLTFIEGPYKFTSSSEILKCDRILLLGGGIGITGLLPWAHAHPNVKLAWSVKVEAENLVHSMETALGKLNEKHISVGERLDLEGLLHHEANKGHPRVGVVVCGPGGMCDEVRAIVAAFGRRTQTVFELEVEAFSW